MAAFYLTLLIRLLIIIASFMLDPMFILIVFGSSGGSRQNSDELKP